MDEYEELLRSLFGAIVPGKTFLSTAEFLNTEYGKYGGYMGEEARKAYMRGELPSKVPNE